MYNVAQSGVDQVALACYLLLRSQARVVFPQSSHCAPSEWVYVYGNTKTPSGYNRIFPVVINWRTWKYAVVPVLNDETVDQGTPINMGLSVNDCVSLIRNLLVSSYANIGLLPTDQVT